MKAKKAFTIQSLFLLLIGNTILLLVVFAVPKFFVIPEPLWVIPAAGAVITLLMWVTLRGLGARAIERALRDVPAATSAPEPKAAPAPDPRPRAEKPTQPPEASAIQVLSILQRQGRLLDFLQEDIQGFDDAQIGAAVRGVHEGCRKALAEHITLEPVLDQPEGSTVTIEPGFDAHAIQLTGHVAGDPPFTGELRHRGWRVDRIDLPELMRTQDRIAAAAEVEVRG
ncbi:MAG: DUF2760 domain-containing protein [Rhodothermales bacterium]